MDSLVKAQKVRTAVAPPGTPDGGYAWLIVLSCFLVFGLTFGVIKAFGVFYVEIHEYFGTTATETSWITSIAVATIHVVGNNLFSSLKTLFHSRFFPSFFPLNLRFLLLQIPPLLLRLVEVVTSRWLLPT